MRHLDVDAWMNVDPILDAAELEPEYLVHIKVIFIMVNATIVPLVPDCLMLIVQ